MYGVFMKTAKIFRSANSQAVRIPKEFQLEGSEVEIVKSGSSLVLRPYSSHLDHQGSGESLFEKNFLCAPTSSRDVMRGSTVSQKSP
jgi:antitoxin VapB